MDVILRQASRDDKTKVLGFYKAAIGTSGCTWNDEYPTEDDLERDFDAGCLFVLVRGDCVIGSVSAVSENELDGFDCWEFCTGAREFARAVIANEYRGRGYGRQMISLLLSYLSGKGCPCVHISVAKSNPAAVRMYTSLGFSFRCAVSIYGGEYFLCEALTDTVRA